MINPFVLSAIFLLRTTNKLGDRHQCFANSKSYYLIRVK